MCRPRPGHVWELAATKYQPTTCTECGGQRGAVQTSWDSDGTRHDTWQTCPACRGTGLR